MVTELAPQSDIALLNFFRELDKQAVDSDAYSRTAVQRFEMLTMIARAIGIHPQDAVLTRDAEQTAASPDLRDARGEGHTLSFIRGDDTFAWGVRRLHTRYARLSGTDIALRDMNVPWPELPHAFFSLTRSRATGYPEQGPFGKTMAGFKACWMGPTMFVVERRTARDADLTELLAPFDERVLTIEGFRLMEDAWKHFAKRPR